MEADSQHSQVFPEAIPLEEIVTKPTTETLKCHLTEDEIKDYGILSARVSAEISQAEDELQAVKSQFKSRIDKQVATRNECTQKINQGYEFRSVDCEIIKDFRSNTVTVVRLDTGQTVRSRTMTADEMQRSFL